MKEFLIKKMYVELGVPCDRLVSDPDKLKSFTDEYCRFSGEKVSSAEMGHKLLNLRRKGQEKGGLPRLQRGYFGRNKNPDRKSA